MVCKRSITLVYFLVTLPVENGCQWNNLLADLNLLSFVPKKLLKQVVLVVDIEGKR